MRQDPLKKQWRVLLPSQKGETSSYKEAFEWGYNTLVVDQEEPVAPLKSVRRVAAPVLSPFSPEFAEFLSALPRGVPLFWESGLFKGDFKEELLKRALLPAEFYLQEIEAIGKKLAGQPLFYLLPHPFSERHLDFLLKRTAGSVYFVHSAVSGDPERLDLTLNPLMHRQESRLIPLYHADPLGSIPIKGQHEASSKESYGVIFNGSFESVSSCLKEIAGVETTLRNPFDKRLCYLQAIASGKENPHLEELRLFADLLIAEMRYEEKRGIPIDQEPKKRLLIRALEKMRMPVPLALSMN